MNDTSKTPKADWLRQMRETMASTHERMADKAIEKAQAKVRKGLPPKKRPARSLKVIKPKKSNASISPGDGPPDSSA